MAKNYFIFSDNPNHAAIYTKGLLLIKPRSGGWISIEFIYSESNTYNWYFDTEKEMYEAYAKVKKSLPAGVNIDDHITL